MNAKIRDKMLFVVVGMLVGTSLCAAFCLAGSRVSADDSVVDQVEINVPISCSMTASGMNSHNAEISIGTYRPDIGITTLKAFCNDSNGFAIYAAGYTGNEIGETNSNKLVGTNVSSNATIATGTATSAGSSDVSNWAMKLAITGDSGDTTGTNAAVIDSDAEGPFSAYHMVPNEYTKVAHKDSATGMDAATGGVTFTTTYAAYISTTQPADTYTGQVIYTLVHPSTAIAPVAPGKVGVTYNANGSTFAGGGETNRVIYVNQPMYIATTPQIAKSSNVASDGTKESAYSSNANELMPVTASGASKMKVEVDYGVSAGTVFAVIEGNWEGQSEPTKYELIFGENATGTTTYVFDGDAVTFYMRSEGSVASGYDYGFYAQVYPIYTTEQTGTELSEEYAMMLVDEGTYAQTTDWYGSWYADIDGQHYDFMSETEITTFLENNIATLSGENIDLYRGLTFTEAYTKAGKSQDGGYYRQQDLDNSICGTVAIAQNQTVKDIRDNNAYMIGRLDDGRCWMLDNLALDPTDSTTASNMNANNTNASAEAINSYLNGGGSTTGWSNVAVVNKTSDWNDGVNAYTEPWVNNQSKNTLVTSYGPASTNGQAKVGVYYNYCAATVGTYCYGSENGVDIPNTDIDASQDICPAGWRMPTGGASGEYLALYNKYSSAMNATDTASLQYNLSTPLSGGFYGNSAYSHGNMGFWWSSSYADGTWMYKLDVNTGAYSGVYPESQGARNAGFSVRCLVSR